MESHSPWWGFSCLCPWACFVWLGGCSFGEVVRALGALGVLSLLVLFLFVVFVACILSFASRLQRNRTEKHVFLFFLCSYLRCGIPRHCRAKPIKRHRPKPTKTNNISQEFGFGLDLLASPDPKPSKPQPPQQATSNKPATRGIRIPKVQPFHQAPKPLSKSNPQGHLIAIDHVG